MTHEALTSREYRYFDPNPAQRTLAAQLYDTVADLPLICPHGHVDPRLFADANYRFGTPVDLLIVPDHYIFRMLYSKGIALQDLGIPTQDGTPVQENHRTIWQLVADHWHLFRGTPTDIWIRDELERVFGITEKLNSQNALAIYDQIERQLQAAHFTPRTLYTQFNIEILATTNAATDTLSHHQTIQRSWWTGKVIPTFRPDAVVNIHDDHWRDEINRLSQVSGVTVRDYPTYIQALEQRRTFFKSLGATATDHAARSAYTESMTAYEAEHILQRALKGEADEDDARRFTGHMLVEMARMSVEDGLVMQLHIGSERNHNPFIFQRFGRDMGADIPLASEFTHNLKPLLQQFGNTTALHLIVFTLDETTYSRELAPLAGHYPALWLGPPWWFFDSVLGMERFFNRVVETAGIYNLAGFNDDTRAFLSIPSRHDVWRRVSANWLAGQVVRYIIDEDDAYEMIHALAYDLAKQAYKYQG